MTQSLELPAVREQVRLITIEEYHRMGEVGLLGEDVELLRGIIVKKMSKSPLHEFVCQKLMTILERVPDEFEVRIQGPVTLRASEPEPDFSVVRGRPEDWLESHPDYAELIIEVAISSEAIDRHKGDLYAEAGFPEYWLVLPAQRAIEVFRRPSPEGYVSQGRIEEGEILHCSAIPELQFAVADIFPKR
jgi:Uma2 family endonuclease